VHIAHGVCAVPTPGTAELLRGMPLVDVPIDAELTTPTGAAILKTVADQFGPLPDMTLEQIGYGAGTKDFPDRANVLRVLAGSASESGSSDRVLVLETNLDDVSAEIIGYTKQKLLAAGALDVFTAPIQMKKDRPGTLLSVICNVPDRDRLEAVLFSETATFGIRRHVVERSKRTRAACVVETEFGPIQGKLGEHAGRQVFTPEFEACAQAAAARNVALRDVYRAADAAFAAGRFSVSSQQAPNSDRESEISDRKPEPHGHDHSHDHTHDSAHDHSHSHDHDHRHDHDHHKH
jgi:pyridinium-3,5-bisthiocarboxylic acid mononucleotide nickel chelatase